jgi:hypothetical protein
MGNPWFLGWCPTAHLSRQRLAATPCTAVKGGRQPASTSSLASAGSTAVGTHAACWLLVVEVPAVPRPDCGHCMGPQVHKGVTVQGNPSKLMETPCFIGTAQHVVIHAVFVRIKRRIRPTQARAVSRRLGDFAPGSRGVGHSCKWCSGVRTDVCCRSDHHHIPIWGYGVVHHCHGCRSRRVPKLVTLSDRHGSAAAYKLYVASRQPAW